MSRSKTGEVHIEELQSLAKYMAMTAAKLDAQATAMSAGGVASIVVSNIGVLARLRTDLRIASELGEKIEAALVLGSGTSVPRPETASEKRTQKAKKPRKKRAD